MAQFVSVPGPPLVQACPSLVGCYLRSIDDLSFSGLVDVVIDLAGSPARTCVVLNGVFMRGLKTLRRCQHIKSLMSASIRQHTLVFSLITSNRNKVLCMYKGIRQHTSAYVSIRQHALVFSLIASKKQGTLYIMIRAHAQICRF